MKKNAAKKRTAFISINAGVIRKNAMTGSSKPPIRIAKSNADQKPVYAREIRINGPSRLIYTPRGLILKCGARMVLTADYNDVEVVR